jgi:hypothetical protein
MSLISISVCLSDIPKDKIKLATNGKKYINLAVAQRKEVSQFGETHTVFVSQDKEEREAKLDICYVGGGKEFTQKAIPVTVEDIEKMPPANDVELSDLPF